MGKIVNFLGFQTLWFSCVLGAAWSMPLAGPLVLVALGACHLWSVSERRAELSLLVAAGAIGFLADSLLVLTGRLQFAEVDALGGPAPLWMVALWVGLAGTLRSSLGWLRGRPVLAAALGAISGPLAYAGGERLGAVALGSPTWLSLTAVGLEWAVGLPLLVLLAGEVPPISEE